MVSEFEIEDYLCDMVKVLGGEVRKVQWIGRKHAPDRLVLLPNYHCFVELKAPKQEPRKGQLREHNRLRKAGFDVYVIDSYDGVDRLLRGK